MNDNKAEIAILQGDECDVELIIGVLRQQHPSRNIVHLKDGAEALAFFLRCYASLKIIILDLTIPNLKAFDILRQIKSDERTRSIPVLVFSSSSSKHDLKRAYDLGANSYILKPLQSDALRQTIAQLGLYWLSLNKLPPRQSSFHEIY